MVARRERLTLHSCFRDDDGYEYGRDTADTCETPDFHFEVADALLMVVKLFRVVTQADFQFDEFFVDPF